MFNDKLTKLFNYNFISHSSVFVFSAMSSFDDMWVDNEFIKKIMNVQHTAAITANTNPDCVNNFLT